MKDFGVPHYWEKTDNLEMMTPQGTLKLTGCVPQTMKNAVLALREKPPGMILDINGLKGFSAHQIVDNLKETWPDLRSARILFPDSGHLGEIYPEYMARALESGISRKKLAAAILPHVQNAKIVGIPAILCIHRSLEIQADLEALIGARLFETPTLPPSVPGLRLKEMFEKACPKKESGSFCSSGLLPYSLSRAMVFCWILRAELARSKKYDAKAYCWLPVAFLERD